VTTLTLLPPSAPVTPAAAAPGASR
jgi:hypothetical protein